MSAKWTEEDEARWQRFTEGRADYGTNASAGRQMGPTHLERARELTAGIWMAVPFVWGAAAAGLLCILVTNQEPGALLAKLFTN